ncbi:MAG: thioredoxin domain-containing protein [Myxococcales bacterium]
MEKTNEAPAVDAVKEIGEAEYEQAVLKATLPAVLDFYAADSEPCKAWAPRFDAVAQKFAGKALFLRISKAKSTALAAKLSVTESPTLVFFKGGKEVGERLKGAAIERKALKAAVEALLK